MHADAIKTIKDIPDENYITGGHAACQGCCASLGLKLALQALGSKTIVINASGCMTLLPTYPFTPFRVPFIHIAIENAGAAAVGIAVALNALKKENVNIVCYAGDGASYDIGLQSLSHACELKTNFIYICYNNESFANTGVQWSSATPYGAHTSTTPSGRESFGSFRKRKPLTKIIAAHNIPYVATACVAYPVDYVNKLRKAAAMKGPKFIDLLTPCTTGWGFDPSEAIAIGRLAVESCMWPLYEVNNGKFLLTYKPQKKPVKDYLFAQRRFKHLSQEQAQSVQQSVDNTWENLLQGKFWEA